MWWGGTVLYVVQPWTVGFIVLMIAYYSESVVMVKAHYNSASLTLSSAPVKNTQGLSVGMGASEDNWLGRGMEHERASRSEWT